MIDKLITYLNNQIRTTNLIQKQYALAELVQDANGKTYPLLYESDGNFKHVSEFSDWYGLSYFRKNGDITSEPDDSENYIPCSDQLLIRVPLKLVCTVLKSQLTCDDEYANDRVAFALIKVIAAKNPGVRYDVKASRLFFDVVSHSTDKREILAGEYSDLEGVNINYEYCYISINLVARIYISKECMLDICPDVLVDEEEDRLVDQNNNELLAT